MTTTDLAARHSSETAEHFTPAPIVDLAREVLGGIDLDPFSCPAANRVVRATRIFTKEEDGFAQAWAGRLFVNPPGSKSEKQSNQKRAWFKLARDYQAGAVTAAIFVCFSVELLQTTQVKTPRGLALPLDFPICYPSRRIAYVRSMGARAEEPAQSEIFGADELIGEGGESPPHASCIVYLPPSPRSLVPEHFGRLFSVLGKVVIPS